MKVRLVVGDPLDGYEPYEDALARYPAEPLEEELEGTRMLYSSGTTGRPKGVKYKIKRQRIGDLPVGDGDDDHGVGHGRGRRSTCRPRRCTTRRRCSIA